MADTVGENIQEALMDFLKKSKKMVDPIVSTVSKRPTSLITPFKEEEIQDIQASPAAKEVHEAMNFPGVSSLGVPAAALGMAKVGVKGSVAAVERMSNARAKILAAEGSIKAMSEARKKILGVGEKPLEDLMKKIPTVTKKATVKEEKSLGAGTPDLPLRRDERARRGPLGENQKSRLWLRMGPPYSLSCWRASDRGHEDGEVCKDPDGEDSRQAPQGSNGQLYECQGR